MLKKILLIDNLLINCLCFFKKELRIFLLLTILFLPIAVYAGRIKPKLLEPDNKQQWSWERITENNVLGIAKGNNNSIFYITKNFNNLRSIYYYNDNESVFYMNIPKEITSDTFFVDSLERIWFYGDENLVFWDGGSWRWVKNIGTNASFKVLDIDEFKDQIWIALYNEGIASFDGLNWQTYNKEDLDSFYEGFENISVSNDKMLINNYRDFIIYDGSSFTKINDDVIKRGCYGFLDGIGNIWQFSNEHWCGDIYKYSFEDEDQEIYYSDDVYKANKIDTAGCFADNTCWFASTGNVNSFLLRFNNELWSDPYKFNNEVKKIVGTDKTIFFLFSENSQLYKSLLKKDETIHEIEKKVYKKPFGITSDLGIKLLGRIILKIEDKGEAWYLSPKDKQAYFLGRPDDAFNVMKSIGVGIANSDLAKIPVGITELSGADTDKDGLSDLFEDAIFTDKNKKDTDNDGYSDKDEILAGYSPLSTGIQLIDQEFAAKQAGKILLQVQNNGEAWYINPVDNKRYFLGRPADAFAVMRYLGLGVSNDNFQNYKGFKNILFR